MKFSLAGLLLAAAALVGSAQAVPPPKDKITIDVVTLNGSGCPPGSAAVAVAPDNTAFTVTYSSYLASAGYGTKPTDGRKNCQLNLRVNVPGGFTFAIASADYRGFASLAAGATGLHQASYYFQGNSLTTSSSKTFKGPMEDNWQVTDDSDVAIYAPCKEKRLFNINTELRVSKGTSSPQSTSYMAVDSADGSITTKYNFSWQKC